MMLLPDYEQGSIVNLMTSLCAGLGGGTGAAASLAALPAEEVAAARHVLLLVADGLGHDYLQRQDPGGALFRHCRGRLTSVFPTTTATAISSFMTGLAPAQHGVTGWFMLLKELGSVATILPFRPRHGGPSYTQLGIDPRRIFDQTSFFDRVPVRSQLLLPRQIAHSDFSVAMSGEGRRHGYRHLEDLTERLRRAIHGAQEPQYIYAYWPEYDSLAHQYGVGSSAAAELYRAFDGWFAALLAELAGTDTLVVVTADHGFIDVPAGAVVQLADHEPLAHTLALPLCGEPRVAYCYVRPDAARAFERYVGEWMTDYCVPFPAEDLIAAGWFGPGEPHPRLRERIGDYVLVMKDNHIIKDRIAAETGQSPIGNHGGLSAAELFVPLVVAAC